MTEINQNDAHQHFVHRIDIDGSNAQLSTLMDVVANLTIENAEEAMSKLPDDNIFILNGVRPDKAGRATDADITLKNCFVLDFDLAKDEENPRSEADIKNCGRIISDAFRHHPVLGRWTFIVFSGGGLHVWYFGVAQKIESPEHYKHAIADLHHEAKALLPDELQGTLDPACVNVGRLFRMPGTKNYKYDPPRNVEIIEERGGIAFDFPKVLARGKELYENRKEAVKALRASEKETKELFSEEGVLDFYTAINKLIPMHEVVCKLKDWETDGKNFWKGNKSKKKACFIPESENFLVHSGTHHLPEGKKGYSVFDFVKTVLELNNRQAFEWFEEHYPDIKEQCESGDSLDALGNDSKAKKALMLALKQDIILFHDQFGDAFVRLPINGHYEIHRCAPRASAIREWLGHLYWKTEGNTLSGEDKSSAIEVLSAMAKYNSERHELHNRAAFQKEKNTIWYDLSDEKGRAISVSPSGWKLHDVPPVLFYREQHQQPQVEPVESGGDAKKLLEYINIEKKEHQLLFLVHVISCFIPHIPHPIAVLHGRPGSAKSTATKMTKALVDPSKMGAFTFPSDATQLVQQMSHHWAPAYDNIDYLTTEQSDALCRATTGGGFSKRVLYTDDDDKIYNFRRCILLNGVNQASTRSDLVDRSLLFSLERILDERRKTERELWDAFEKDAPVILGGIFDVLVEAMKLHPHITLKSFPRMADFAEWGCAIAVALGCSQEDFESALEANKEDQNDAVLGEDWLAPVVQKFMATKEKPWEGTATELLALLEAEGAGIRHSTRPNTLSRHLQLISNNLEAVGIKMTKKHRGKDRVIRLTKTSSVSSVSAEDEPKPTVTDGIDDVSGNMKLDIW
ncbi:MAG: hypothetical protein KC680_01370 [Candidatus Peregrinibacteria bacterium]|nr:hypothetical protein [Candidatus Peregrinibacteria bacterium]MCB9808323.1 hypothetical protein [Candidatus Peribacteria bacterium]